MAGYVLERMKVDRNSRPDDDALTDALCSMFFKRLDRMKVKKFVEDLHAVAPREPVLVLPPGAQHTSTSGQQFEAPFAESFDISPFLEAEASVVPGAQGPDEVRHTNLSSSSRGVGAAGREAAFDPMPSAQYDQRPLPQQP